jgi:hypothetical protein
MNVPSWGGCFGCLFFWQATCAIVGKSLWRPHFVNNFILFFNEFSEPGDKKKGLPNPTKGLLRILKKNRHTLRKKTQKSTDLDRVPVGRQN